MDGVGDMAGMDAAMAMAITDTAMAIADTDMAAAGMLADGLGMAVLDLDTVEDGPDMVAARGLGMAAEHGRAVVTVADIRQVAVVTLAAAVADTSAVEAAA